MSPLSDDRARELRATARKADEWRQRRDVAIRMASEEGASLRDIAEVVGLSHVGVMKIVQRLEAAHIKPLSQGGRDAIDNVVIVERSENRRKR